LFFHEWEYIYFLRRVLVQGSKFWFSVQALFRKNSHKVTNFVAYIHEICKGISNPISCIFHAFELLSIKRNIHPFLPFRRECICALENKLQKFVFLHKIH
jgi:hypothetical protein